MKSIKYLVVFSVIILLATFISCESDHDLSLESDKVEVLIGTSQSININSVDGGFTVAAEDPSIVDVSIVDNSLNLFARKVGKTIVNVSDKNHKWVKIEVIVTPEIIGIWELEKYEYVIKCNSLKSEEIRYDMIQQKHLFDYVNLVIGGGALTLTIIHTDKTEEKKAGKYSYEDGYLTLSYDNQNYTYKMDRNNDVLRLTENFTEFYQNKYPDVSIQEASRQMIWKRVYLPL